MTRRTVDVAVITNRAYLPWCATTMLSCREATTDADVRFHAVVSEDVSSSDRERLAVAAGTVVFVDMDETIIARLPPGAHWPGGFAGWARTALAELLPSLDRVVYLDTDTLVRKSVLPLRDALAGQPIAAVASVTHPATYPHLRSLGFEDPKGYFNSGVLVIDLDVWRTEGSGARLAQVARSRPVRWPDQDALNVVFARRWTHLHPRWNAMNGLWGWPEYASVVFSPEELEEARSDPAILHFEGPAYVKPWHYLNQHPLRDEYRATLARTPWAATPVQGRTVAARVVTLLAGERRLRAYEAWKQTSDRVRRIPTKVRSALRF